MVLSIIVPFYNVDKYIGKCLDSLLNQDIKDYEIICVNDCSQDSSREIVLDYKSRFSNILLIDHTINKKVGGARNTGLLHASGVYVWFVDSDDYLPQNILKYLVGLCVNDDLDVLTFNITTVTNNGETIYKENAFADKCDRIYTGENLLAETFGIQLIYNMGYPYRGILKRVFLNNINAQFPENISYGEDTIFITRCLMYALRSKSISDSCYNYRQNQDSITNQLEKKYKGELVYQSIIIAGNLIQNLMNELLEGRQIQSLQSIRTGMPWFVNRLVYRLLNTNNKERNVFFKLCKENVVFTNTIYCYANRINRFVLKFQTISNWIISSIRPIYILKSKIH